LPSPCASCHDTPLFTSTLIAAALPLMTQAQAQGPAPVAGDAGWRECAALADGQARLVCFDQWAGRQAWAAPAASASAQPADDAAIAPATPATPLAGLKPADGR
jgi:phospholipase A1